MRDTYTIKLFSRGEGIQSSGPYSVESSPLVSMYRGAHHYMFLGSDDVIKFTNSDGKTVISNLPYIIEQE